MSPAASVVLQITQMSLGRRVALRRQGLTLIELLVTVFIVLLITAIAIPLINPSLESRRLTESSRLVTGFIQGARTRAIQEQRPVGVWLEPMTGNSSACNTLFYAHVPPPYAGDSVGTTVTVASGGSTVNFNSATFDSTQVSVNDFIKFNYQGHLYKITAVNASSLTISTSGSTATNYPAAGDYAFQIYRRPIRLPGAPLTLPEGRVLDMSIATTSITAGLPAGSAGPYVILFSPGGSVSGLFYGGSSGSSISVTGPVHLLIGKTEQVAPTATSMTNWEDLENLWVAIHPQTGLVTRAEVASGTTIAQSQQIVQTGLNMGGR